MTTPTPADATRTLTVKAVMSAVEDRRRWHGRLALATPGLIVMAGGFVLLSILPEERAVGIVAFIVGALFACAALTIPSATAGTVPTRREPSGPAPSLEARFAHEGPSTDELIATATWLAADGLDRGEALVLFRKLHNPTRSQLEHAVIVLTQRLHRRPSSYTIGTQALRLLIDATAQTPFAERKAA